MAFSNSWTNSTPADPCNVTIAPNANDYLIAYAITDTASAGDLDNTPTGWAALCSVLQSTVDNQSFRAWGKVADGSETTVALTGSSANTIIGGVLAYSGINTTTPLDVAVVPDTQNSSGTDHDISITPSSNGCDIVFIEGRDNGNSDYAFTFSTTSGTTGSWNTRTDQNSGFYNVAAGDASQTTAGAITARCNSTAGGRAGILLALRPSIILPGANAPTQRSRFPEPATRSRRGRGLKSWLTPHSWWREALA